MSNRNSSRTGLFLMELILAVLFFSLAGVVCIRLFVSSHTLSEKSVELNHGILWAQNVAEAFYGCNGDGKEMADLFEGCHYGTFEDDTTFLDLFFDENFVPYPDGALTDFQIKNDEYEYRLCTRIRTQEHGLLSCNIYLYKPTEKDYIYELNLSLFPQ